MKKVLTVLVALAMVLSISIPVMASANTLEWKDGFGFHCNNAKGNGKVTTGAEKAIVTLERVGTSTVWDLVTSVDDAIVCPSCARVDWVTFSNKNGVINGKNIQVNHSGNPVYLAEASAKLVLVDIVEDCEGEIVSKDVDKVFASGKFFTNQIAIFDFDIPEGFEIVKGVNPVEIAFEAIAGQNIVGGTVVAVRVTTLDCECEIEEIEDPIEDPVVGPAVCAPCLGGGNVDIEEGHKNCFGRRDASHPQFMDCGCWCNV